MLRSLHLLASASRYSPTAKIGVLQAVERSAWLQAAWPSQCNMCCLLCWLLHVLSLTWAACLQVWPQLAVCTV